MASKLFKQKGALDTGLELLGGLMGVTDPLGIGYGEWAEKELGEAIGNDRYLKNYDEVIDVFQEGQRGISEGASQAVGFDLAGTTEATSGMMGIDRNAPQNQYTKQEKLRSDIHAAGDITGQVAGTILAAYFTGGASLGTGLGNLGLESEMQPNSSEMLQGGSSPVSPNKAGNYGGYAPSSSSSMPGYTNPFELPNDFSATSPMKMAKGGSVPKSSPSNLPTFGRPKIYKGQSHEGAEGGIPIDEQGNPSAVSGKSSVALTEDGEVVWGGYVFSNRDF